MNAHLRVFLGNLTLAAAAGLLAAPILAQDEYSRLGLSAAPDSYVPVLETAIGEPFTLYVVLAGPGGTEPLPFGMDQVEWTVFTGCCGASPVEISNMIHPANMVCEGDPYLAVQATAIECLDGDVILLAEVEFDWLLEGETTFPLAAGSAHPALDCSGGYHLLMGLTVEIFGQPTQTPNHAMTWGGIKGLYSR